MNDKRILQLLLRRADEAIEAMAKAFGQRLTITARHILGDWRDAEESVNDTYLAVWNAIPPKEPDPLSGFVYKTGRNLALKRLRHNTAQRRDGSYDESLEELSNTVSGVSLEDEFDVRMLGKAINKFLGTISRDSRIIFLRRYWFGDSPREIAKHLDMTENAVTVRLSRTRQQLRSYLIKEGYVL